MKYRTEINPKTAYRAVINHIDTDIETIQERIAEYQQTEIEPTCQSIADHAILRRLHKLRIMLESRQSKL